MHAGNGAYHGSSAPAVSSKRMTYGSLSSQNREGRERQELFAGADPYRTPYQQQQQVPQEELNNEQLMRQAVAEHKDTTATAHRARQVLEQTLEIQGNTQAALADQRQQMHRIEDDLDKIGQDLTYSERILRFMKLCCCFGFCCSCLTEPGRSNQDKKWRGTGAGPSYEPHHQSMQQQNGRHHHQQQQQHAMGQPGSSAYPGVSTQGLHEIGYGEQATEIETETQKQNQYLDEISRGLDQLKFGAQQMNQELRYQESHADRIRGDADTLGYKLQSVNREGFKRI